MSVINNLAASMLWHKFTVLDPPKELLSGVQKAFVNFLGMAAIGFLQVSFIFLQQREVND